MASLSQLVKEDSNSRVEHRDVLARALMNPPPEAGQG
jgi:hypothetical protein